MNDNELPLSIARMLHASETTAENWKLELIDAGAGWAHVAMPVGDTMLNGHGTAHGGMIFALADTAFAYACNSNNERSFAFHASITFLSAAKAGERLEAIAKELSRVGRSGVYSVKVTGENGRDVAIFEGVSRTTGGKNIDEKTLERVTE